MKTTHVIALAVSLVLCAAPAAVARQVIDPPAPEACVAGAACIAAHHERLSDAQWQRSQAPSPATPLEDRTTTDGRLPLLLAGTGVFIALGIVLLQVVGKSVLVHSRRRRSRARVV
jgi:hypothetical protein